MFAVVFFIFAAVGILIYSNTFHASFHLDDVYAIKMDGGGHPLNLQSLWSNPDSSRRRFLVDLTLALNYRFGALEVTGYHCINLAIHIAASFFAFLLALLTMKTPALKGTSVALSGKAIAFFTGLIFLCHPIQTESVTYICQRYTAMAGLFYLAGLTFYAAFRLQAKKIWFVLSVIAAIAGFFSKENFYTFPFAVVLYDFCFFRSQERGEPAFQKMRNWGIFPLLALTIYFVCGTSSVISTYGEKLQFYIPRSHYFMTQFGVLVRYLGCLIWPYNQNFDHDILIQRDFFSWGVAIPFMILTGLFLLAIYLFRSRRRLAAFCIFWFFLTLSIESSFLPLEDVMVEHRLYLAVFGFTLGFVFCLFKFISSPRKYLYLLIYFFLLSFLTYQRNFVYMTDLKLWSDVVSKSPEKYRSWAALAIAANNAHDEQRAVFFAERALQLLKKNYEKDSYYFRGMVISNFRYITSILLEAYANELEMESFDKKVDEIYSINPFASRASQEAAYELDKDYSNIAIKLVRRGRYSRAEKFFKKATELNPRNAVNFANYGEFLMSQGRYEEAIEMLNQACRLNPKFETAHRSLTAVRQRMTRLEKGLVRNASGISNEQSHDSGAILNEVGADSGAVEPAFEVMTFDKSGNSIGDSGPAGGGEDDGTSKVGKDLKVLVSQLQENKRFIQTNKTNEELRRLQQLSRPVKVR